MATFVKSWEGKNRGTGGLFGAPPQEHEIVLPWSRAQQAAFIIAAGRSMREAIKNTKAGWSTDLRNITGQTLFDEEDDPAFYGSYSLLSTDQGIRGFLAVTNDVFYVQADSLNLSKWRGDPGIAATDDEAVKNELQSIRKQAFAVTLDMVSKCLATYDWRTSSAPSLSEAERRRQGIYRGSSGYRELRRDLLRHLTQASRPIGPVAVSLIKTLGY